MLIMLHIQAIIGGRGLRHLQPLYRKCVYRSLSSRVLTATTLSDSVHVELSVDGQAKTLKTALHNFWLRDSCTCSSCCSATSNQRLFDTTKLDSNTAQPEQLESNGSELIVKWKDGHCSVFSSDWLLKHSFEISDDAIDRISWGREIGKNPPQTNFSAVMTQDSSVLDLYQNIEKYGFCFVNGVPTEKAETTERLVERVGSVRHTFYGGFAIISPDLSQRDTAYTNLAIEPHTDGNYFHNTPGFILFHILEYDGIKPCYNYLVDGQKLCQTIKEENPEHFDILCNVPLSYHHSDPVNKFTNSWIPFKLDPSTGKFLELHFNNHDRLPITKLSFDALLKIKPNGTMSDIYEAIKTIIETSQRKELQYEVILEPGNALILDNYRLMHARSSFEGKRVMATAYMEKEDFLSKVQCIKEKKK